MKKRIFATLLALVMALGLTATAWADDPVTGVEYVDENGITKTCTEYTVVEDSGGLVTWNAGWYVVNGNVTIEPSAPILDGSRYTAVRSSGNVRLILCDGAKLTVKL